MVAPQRVAEPLAPNDRPARECDCPDGWLLCAHRDGVVVALTDQAKPYYMGRFAVGRFRGPSDIGDVLFASNDKDAALAAFRRAEAELLGRDPSEIEEAPVVGREPLRSHDL